MFQVYSFQVVVSPRPDITVSVFGNGTDVLVGTNRCATEQGGREKADRTLFLIYLVDAGTISSGPDDAGLHFAQ